MSPICGPTVYDALGGEDSVRVLLLLTVYFPIQLDKDLHFSHLYIISCFL